MNYLHKESITHRDLKMENILIDCNHNIKIIDFGFSILAPRHIRLKIFCGTPSYMSPEIVRKQEYLGQPSDIWSLGIVLYSLLCGVFPFKGNTDRELFDRICKGVYFFPPFLSERAKCLLKRILIKDPSKRIDASKVVL